MYRIPNFNPNDLNTSVVNYYQHTAVSFRDVVLLGVLEVCKLYPALPLLLASS